MKLLSRNPVRVLLRGEHDRSTVVSLQAHPDRLHILVAVVSYKTKLFKRRRGLCSSWLASLDPAQGQSGRLRTAAFCCCLFVF